MAFLKDNKRKIVTSYKHHATEAINIDLKSKTIKDGTKIADFERLLYKGCPVMPRGKRNFFILDDKETFINLNRKPLIIKICNSIHNMDATNRTKINVYRETLRFIRMMDGLNIMDIFSFENISIYLNSLMSEYNNGVKGKTLSSRQNSMKSLLKSIDFELFKKCEKLFFSFPDDTDICSPYTDGEVKELLFSLQLIYSDYSQHIKKGTKPKLFPLHQKDIDGKLRYKNSTSSIKRISYGRNDSVWVGDLVRVAYYMTCFYTGANAASLIKLKLSDFSPEPFKDINRRSYKLTTKKGRQSGKVNEISIGFTKEAKCFFEGWIEISRKINNSSDGYLFPNPSSEKKLYFDETGMGALNKIFLNLGLPALSSQRFRKTKATLIMRATESVFFVSQGLNNSVETAAKYYADGNPVTTEFSLASALYIREQTALGKPLDDAISESAFLYKDPLKGSEVSKKFKKLTNGLRCGGPFKDKAVKLKDVLVKNGLAESHDVVACHKFLECFGCRHHAIIAEVDDIWLLLSFNDVILESLIRPAINSRPSNLLNKVNNTIQVIIERIKREHSVVYKEAYEKYLNEMHPLWQDTNDLELILGIY